MKFGTIPVAEAEGAILAHSLRLPGGSFKKGRVLSADDIARLTAEGITDITAARLDADDMPEDAAAERLAAAARGAGTGASAPFTGRCNLYAEADGVLVVDRARLDAINLLDEAVTIATLPPFETVSARQMVATIKVIPFAAPRAVVARAAALAAEGTPLIRVQPFLGRQIGLVLSRLPGLKESILDGTVRTVTARVRGVGARLVGERRVDHASGAIAEAVQAMIRDGADMILISGASAIVDRRDVIPQAIVDAGGEVDHFGMPVDPGNLLLLGHCGPVPVLGLPGCARSPKLNGFDWVLARLAAGLAVAATDIMAMGAGGLLKEIPSRPQPRHGEADTDRDSGTRSDPAASRAVPRIAALLLAAGQSRRMGAVNKLLADVDGKPMVRRAAEAALAARVDRLIVVTGHEAARVRAALEGLSIEFVHNPDFADGLSASLRHGISAVMALTPPVDGCLVCLGDMPRIAPDDLNKLIAAFDPDEGRTICVPTHDGKRGNPVLWGARFFRDMATISGDVGARHLIGDHADQVAEVAIGDPGILLDIDTPEALAAHRRARSA